MKKLLILLAALSMHMQIFASDSIEESQWEKSVEENQNPNGQCIEENQCGCKFNWCRLTDPAWWRCGWDAQVRIGAFHPQYNLFRRIYGRWGIEYEGEAAKYLTTRWCGDIYAWGNLSYYSSKGHSVGLGHRTRIYVVPLSVGLKYQYAITDCTSVYTGLGIACTILRIHDQSPFVIKHTRRTGCGAVVKFGIRQQLTCRFFVDFFADYLYQKFNFHSTHRIHRHNAEVGGWKIGGGFGMVF